MIDLCSGIVERTGSSWAYLGWALFGVWFLSPWFLIGMTVAGTAVWIGLGLALLLWWAIDIVDQQVALWQIAVGVVMLGVGCLPRGGLLLIACWVVYWTRVRV